MSENQEYYHIKQVWWHNGKQDKGKSGETTNSYSFEVSDKFGISFLIIAYLSFEFLRNNRIYPSNLEFMAKKQSSKDSKEPFSLSF